MHRSRERATAGIGFLLVVAVAPSSMFGCSGGDGLAPSARPGDGGSAIPTRGTGSDGGADAWRGDA